MRTTAAAALAVIAALGIALAAERAAPDEAKPPGEDTSLTTDALALGAKVLQTSAPLSAFDVHLVGFHPMKDEPGHQMLSHHFCEQVNEDFAQCVLFDGDGADANLNGVEFIVSEKLFERLPAEERELWHRTITRSSRASSSRRGFPRPRRCAS